MKTLSISEAKAHLGEMADMALKGEPVLIVRKSRLLVLKEFDFPEPVPVRSSGYFDDCYTRVEAKESNRLAAKSTKKLVR